MGETLRIGVVGYTAPKFDVVHAKTLIKQAYDTIAANWEPLEMVVVSGLTDLGIPALAYREAGQRDWRTVRIACSRALEFNLFPVNERIIVGSGWGDESETFLASIDVLVRVGGGKQAISETARAKQLGKPVFEYDLPVMQ